MTKPTANELISHFKLNRSEMFKLGIELITLSNNATENELKAIYSIKKQPEITEQIVEEAFSTVFGSKPKLRLRK